MGLPVLRGFLTGEGPFFYGWGFLWGAELSGQGLALWLGLLVVGGALRLWAWLPWFDWGFVGVVWLPSLGEAPLGGAYHCGVASSTSGQEDFPVGEGISLWGVASLRGRGLLLRAGLPVSLAGSLSSQEPWTNGPNAWWVTHTFLHP